MKEGDSKLGLHEDRVRVTCHLPVNNAKEERALHKIIAYIKEQRKGPGRLKGFTASEHRPTNFYGFWWDTTRRAWVRDKLVLLVVDYRLSFSDERLSAVVSELKQTILSIYEDCGSPQEEVWVVAQQVIRQD